MLLCSLTSLFTSHSSNAQQSKDVSSLSFGLLSAHPRSEKDFGIEDAKLRQGQRNHTRISKESVEGYLRILPVC